MRYLFAALVLAAVFGTAAQAEKRTFIIANNSDGYGVDRCLATGATCGAAVATAYCKAHDYAEAASFRRIEREEIACAVPTTNGTSARDEFVALQCLRWGGATPSARRPGCHKHPAPNIRPRGTDPATGPAIALRCAALDLRPMFAAAVEA